MYKVISINNAIATRTVKLKNQDTGTVDMCFDDSALISVENFEFMQQGQTYDCKIKLFGNVVDHSSDNNKYTVVAHQVQIGKKFFSKVLKGQDIYYISTMSMSTIDALTGREIFFDCTRKDLIQVNNVIYSDLL